MNGEKINLVILVILFTILNCLSHAHEKNIDGKDDQDSTEYHAQHADDRKHLLAHISDRMDLDGEGLRHIKNHLGKVVGNVGSQEIEDIEKGDNEKGIFYFFKLHDYDNNNKLDGLELMSALSDFHQDDDVDDEKEGGKNFEQEEVVKIADELLEKHDKNKDGMIDFPEMMNSKVDSLMTELDKNIEQPEQPATNGTQEQEKH